MHCIVPSECECVHELWLSHKPQGAVRSRYDSTWISSTDGRTQFGKACLDKESCSLPPSAKVKYVFSFQLTLHPVQDQSLLFTDTSRQLHVVATATDFVVQVFWLQCHPHSREPTRWRPTLPCGTSCAERHCLCTSQWRASGIGGGPLAGYSFTTQKKGHAVPTSCCRILTATPREDG